MKQTLIERLGIMLPSNEIMNKVEIECAIEEETGKCVHCGKDSHFGPCDNETTKR